MGVRVWWRVKVCFNGSQTL